MPCAQRCMALCFRVAGMSRHHIRCSSDNHMRCSSDKVLAGNGTVFTTMSKSIDVSLLKLQWQATKIKNFQDVCMPPRRRFDKIWEGTVVAVRAGRWTFLGKTLWSIHYRLCLRAREGREGVSQGTYSLMHCEEVNAIRLWKGLRKFVNYWSWHIWGLLLYGVSFFLSLFNTVPLHSLKHNSQRPYGWVRNTGTVRFKDACYQKLGSVYLLDRSLALCSHGAVIKDE